jgi:hypothetical protein
LTHIKLNEKKIEAHTIYVLFWCRYQCDRVKEVKLILTPIVYIYIYSGKIDIKTVDTQQQQQQQQTTNKQTNKTNIRNKTKQKITKQN